MTLPFNLQKLPPEALDVLRFLGKGQAAATPEQMETGAALSSRLVGKAIRRLVNADYIEMAANGYQLTTDGKRAVQQLADFDTSAPTQVVHAVNDTKPVIKIERHMSVVMPRAFLAGHSASLYLGVNPPENDGPRLSAAAQLELKMSAVGGTLSATVVSLEVPPNKAAVPAKIILTPADNAQTVRVRVDAFQTLDIDESEPLGGMYFDIRVSKDPIAQDGTLRAVGLNVQLIQVD